MIEREFEKGDLEGTLNLLKTCYNGWHDCQYWRWKYEENPHAPPIIWVAEDEKTIIGCYALNPVKLRIGGVTLKAAQAVDAAVHPDYRGSGIFKRLAANAVSQASRECIAIIYAFPSRIAFKGQLRIGYSPLFPIPKMFKVFRPHALSKKTESSNLLFRSAKLVASFLPNFQLRKTNAKPDGHLELRKVWRLDKRYVTFWRRFCGENEAILVERDAAYMHWRYHEHPENEYVMYVCEKDDEIVGFTVLSLERNASLPGASARELVVGNIVDLFTLQDDMHNVVSALISVACNHFRNENVDVAMCWIPEGHAYRSIFQESGFHGNYTLLRRVIFRSKYDDQFIYYLSSRPHIARAFESLPKKNKPCWLLMQGDADFM